MMGKTLVLIFCLYMASFVHCKSFYELFNDYENLHEELLRQRWEAFKQEHNKNYISSLEESARQKIFIANSRKIEEHNDLFEKGVETYAMRMNQFGDLLAHEFEELMLMKNMTRDESDRENAATFIPIEGVEVPKSVDWRKRGAVTAVKNQGSCGSCWAFAATGALEGQYFRKTGHLVSLSEQQLVDCSKRYGNFGCKGGFAHKSFSYIHDNKGIDSEDSYPYQGKDLQCRYNPKYSAGTCNTYMFIAKSERALQKAVAQKGPVTVDVNSKLFQFYSHGVFYNKKCSGAISKLDHLILAVGYGKDRRFGKYWLVKNSWGGNWGEKGYIRIARDRNNQCGVASYASIPIVYVKCCAVATCKGYVEVKQSEYDLKLAIAQKGPISVAVNADPWQFYSHGIFYDQKCSSTNLNHGVLAVGYGKSRSGEYWIVKNSWTEGWGERGYIKIAKNRNNQCGVASWPVYPIV